MSDKELILAIKKVKDDMTIPGLVTAGRAAMMLDCSANTIRSQAAKGNIRSVWICYAEPTRLQLFYRVDVAKLVKEKQKTLKVKLESLERKTK